MEFLQYQLMKMLKNRLVFSAKYGSEMNTLGATPHVVVFCIAEPDMSLMCRTVAQ